MRKKNRIMFGKCKTVKDDISGKARVVYNNYKIYYQSGVMFLGQEVFRKNIDHMKLVKLWGREEIVRLYNMIVAYDYESEFYAGKNRRDI